MNAHVCRYPKRLTQGTRGRSTDVPLTGGFLYSGIQSRSQRRPRPPVATNAHCHPHRRAIHGTTSGVRMAPVFVPALKIPVASARSLWGNHSATALMEPGKMADSLTPSIARANENPAAVLANAWPIAAILHATTAVAKPRRTPLQSITRPAARKPNAYAKLNHETMSP